MHRLEKPDMDLVIILHRSVAFYWKDREPTDVEVFEFFSFLRRIEFKVEDIKLPEETIQIMEKKFLKSKVGFADFVEKVLRLLEEEILPLT